MDMNRIMGVITLKAPVYRQIAEDAAATQPAGIIVAIVALIAGFSNGLFSSQANFVSAIIAAIVYVVLALIGWFVGSWLLAFVSKWFGGKTNTQEMLRVTGFVYVFNIVSAILLVAAFLPVLACLAFPIIIVVAILQVIGFVIGVREAAEVSTGKAVLTAIVAWVIIFVITSVIGGTILGAIGLTSGLMTPLPQ